MTFEMKWLKLSSKESDLPFLVNTADISEIRPLSDGAHLVMRSMDSNGNGGLNAKTSHVKETFEEIEVMLGLRKPPTPVVFSLEDLEAAQDHINGHGASKDATGNLAWKQMWAIPYQPQPKKETD